VIINDTAKEIVFLLIPNHPLHHAEIIAKVQLPRRLDSAEYSFHLRGFLSIKTVLKIGKASRMPDGP